uniref:hypothetical protein n=1 Tax=uncultured Dysgonomonas sp. TaxID=206096 RepID=UPI0026201803|nr:hypothetical protein [uncultured Dysgonomonas sp.]
MKNMKNIRIEEVGDINFDLPYLQVFSQGAIDPFLEIGISEEKKVFFKFYPTFIGILLDIEEWEYILETAKAFLPEALKNESDFLNYLDQ